MPPVPANSSEPFRPIVAARDVQEASIAARCSAIAAKIGSTSPASPHYPLRTYARPLPLSSALKQSATTSGGAASVALLQSVTILKTYALINRSGKRFIPPRVRCREKNSFALVCPHRARSRRQPVFLLAGGDNSCSGFWRVSARFTGSVSHCSTASFIMPW